MTLLFVSAYVYTKFQFVSTNRLGRNSIQFEYQIAVLHTKHIFHVFQLFDINFQNNNFFIGGRGEGREV